MAQLAFRLNVTAAQFPFLSDQSGATVIVPGNDTYYVRPNGFTGETADSNLGIPQITFIENVMPTSYGISSIGFSEVTVPFPGNVLEADQEIYLRGQTGRRYLLNFHRPSGKGSIYSPELAAWVPLFAIPVENSQAYVCLVKGRCFLAFKNHIAMFEFKGFNTFTNSFEMIVFTGFPGIDDLSQIFGIVSANNFLIFFTRTFIFYTIPDEVYGSLPDFTPSLGATAAASETPSVLKGIILTCLPTQDGFYIFTSTNIVAAYYSGNVKFPWTYRELEGSAAINSLDQIATDRDNYPKYVYTSAGFLKIGKSNCTPVFLEASEFVGNSIFEKFNWDTKEITRVELIEPINFSLAYVANRWLVISYGLPREPFSYAVVYDEHLKRWGKLQFIHSRAVEFFGIPATLQSIPGITYGDELNAGWSYQDLLTLDYSYRDLGSDDFTGTPDVALEYKSIGLVAPNGKVSAVNFDLTDLQNNSVAILGRVQFTRNSRFKITSMYLENYNTNPITGVCNAYILPSNDLKNPSRTEVGWLARAGAGGSKLFHFAHAEGVNHQLRFEGDFDLSTIVIVGKRTGSVYGRY